MPRNIVKWLPALVVPAAVIAGVIVLPMQAGAAPQLPTKSAKDVLLMIAASRDSAFSGTVVSTSDLGLPQLSLSTGMSQSMIDSMSSMVPKGMESFVPKGASTSGLASALELAGGSHTARIFVDSRNSHASGKIRVQLEDKLAERNVVSNGTDAWSFDSNSNTATHLTIPTGSTTAAKARVTAAATALGVDLTNPSTLATEFLARIDPSTRVSVGSDSIVAGRSAYELVLTPKTSGTLVGSVDIAVDSKTGLPLKVSVLARGQKAPAFEVALTSVDFTAPSANVFAFTPPAGAKIVEQKLPQLPATISGLDQSSLGSLVSGLPKVTGTGWDSIVEISAVSVPAELKNNPLITQVSTAVTGGRALSTALATIYFASDGRILIGSVPLSALEIAASSSATPQ